MPEGNICCDYLVGCCYLMKKDFFTYLGGFDEDFFMYFEDNDLCDRVIKKTAMCKSCNSDAIFSHRISEEKDQVVIGSLNYIPLCRRCYSIMIQ